MFEGIETVITSQHIGSSDNLDDNKKAVVETCKKETPYDSIMGFWVENPLSQVGRVKVIYSMY